MATAGFLCVLNWRMARGPQHIHNEMPEGWEETYEAKSMIIGDPVVLWALKNTGRVRWSEIKIPDLRNVFEAAATFGLQYGAAICIVSQNKRHLISCARSDREFTDAEIAKIETISHELITDVYAQTDLTEKERTTLMLLADGARNQEVADRLNISLATVKSRIDRIKKKTNANTVAQAVAIGVHKSLL